MPLLPSFENTRQIIDTPCAEGAWLALTVLVRFRISVVAYYLRFNSRRSNSAIVHLILNEQRSSLHHLTTVTVVDSPTSKLSINGGLRRRKVS